MAKGSLLLTKKGAARGSWETVVGLCVIVKKIAWNIRRYQQDNLYFPISRANLRNRGDIPGITVPTALTKRLEKRGDGVTHQDMLRADIIHQCLAMTATGLNHGVSGNISARFGDRMLITPSGTAYGDTTPDMIASVSLDDPAGAWNGPLKPSSEWRFHQAIYNARGDVNAIVHAHPIYCTALAMARKPLPAAHYMVAIFGGSDVRCSGYATFGTEELSREAVAALDGRTACLLANHGMITLGDTLDKAMWRATELEVLAQQYCVSLTIGGPVILDDDAMADTHGQIAGYGLQDD